MKSRMMVAGLCFTATAVAACTKEEAAKQMGALPQGATVVATAGGGIALRSEAQAFLDSARALIAGKDLTSAAALLDKAAPMLREHADMPTSAAKNELRAAAAAVDSLRDRLNAGVTVTALELQRLMERVNLAEAEHHRSQAAVAWASKDNALTGEELIMSADHLERALQDAYGKPAASRKKLIDDALLLGGQMAKGAAFVDTDVNASLAGLGNAIRAEQATAAGVPIHK